MDKSKEHMWLTSAEREDFIDEFRTFVPFSVLDNCRQKICSSSSSLIRFWFCARRKELLLLWRSPVQFLSLLFGLFSHLFYRLASTLGHCSLTELLVWCRHVFWILQHSMLIPTKGLRVCFWSRAELESKKM